MAVDRVAMLLTLCDPGYGAGWPGRARCVSGGEVAIMGTSVDCLQPTVLLPAAQRPIGLARSSFLGPSSS